MERAHEGRIWVAAADGTVLEEAWIAVAGETLTVLRTSGWCLLEETSRPGCGVSTTVVLQNLPGQLWVEAPPGPWP
jgi:hypothetical protein